MVVQLEKNASYGEVNHELESIDLSSEVKKGESIKTAIRQRGIITCSKRLVKVCLLITLAKLSAHYGLGLKSLLGYNKCNKCLV